MILKDLIHKKMFYRTKNRTPIYVWTNKMQHPFEFDEVFMYCKAKRIILEGYTFFIVLVPFILTLQFTLPCKSGLHIRHSWCMSYTVLSLHPFVCHVGKLNHHYVATSIWTFSSFGS